jgi:hypothetical protein
VRHAGTEKRDADTNIGQADSMNVEEVATKIATEMNVDRSSPWQRSVRQRVKKQPERFRKSAT